MQWLVPSSTVLLVIDVQERLAAAMPEEARERAGTDAFKAVSKLVR